MKATPAQAAARAASKHGVLLTDAAAEEVAAAVLCCHDDAMYVRATAERHVWEDATFRQEMRARMRRHLFSNAADHDVIPACPPEETRSYLPPGHWMPSSNAPEVPAKLAESGDAPWETIVVTLTVPVRRA